MQATCSNVTERTFSLVAPGWIGVDGASAGLEEFRERESGSDGSCKVLWQRREKGVGGMAAVEAEIVKVSQSWRGKEDRPLQAMKER